jgi:hypothetical protein
MSLSMLDTLKAMLRAAMLCALSGLLPSPDVFAGEHTIAPSGEYAQIDVRLSNEALISLTRGSAGEKQKTAERIEARPEDFAPPVFYALSRVLFDRGRKDEAMFWFYAGQLRARFDANRCADISATEAVAVLNREYGPVINQYAFKDIAKLEELIPRVVEWDRKTPYSYDHRWINLHGMGSILSGLEPDRRALSLPKDQWEPVAEATRNNYLNDFRAAMRTMKESAPQGR